MSHFQVSKKYEIIMDVDYVVSHVSTNFHKKIGQYVACIKETNDMWIVHDTIHLSFLFFAQDIYGNILGWNFVDALETT